MGRFEYYRDRVGLWRWHLKAPDGRIIADSGRGYRYKQDCIAGAHLVKVYAASAQVTQIVMQS